MKKTIIQILLIQIIITNILSFSLLSTRSSRILEIVSDDSTITSTTTTSSDTTTNSSCIDISTCEDSLSANINTFFDYYYKALESYFVKLRDDDWKWIGEQPWSVTTTEAENILIGLGTFNNDTFVCPSNLTDDECTSLKTNQQKYHNALLYDFAYFKLHFETNVTTILQEFTGIPNDSKHTYLSQFYIPYINDVLVLWNDAWVGLLPGVTLSNATITNNTDQMETDQNLLVNKTVNFTLTYLQLESDNLWLTNSTVAGSWDKKAHGSTIAENIDYYTTLLSSAFNDLWNKQYKDCVENSPVSTNPTKKVSSTCTDTVNKYIVNTLSVQQNYLYGFGAQLISSSMIAFNYTNQTDFVYDNANILYQQIHVKWGSTIAQVCYKNSLAQGGEWKPKQYPPTKPTKDSKKKDDTDSDSDASDAESTAEDDVADAQESSTKKTEEDIEKDIADDIGKEVFEKFIENDGNSGDSSPNDPLESLDTSADGDIPEIGDTDEPMVMEPTEVPKLDDLPADTTQPDGTEMPSLDPAGLELPTGSSLEPLSGLDGSLSGLDGALSGLDGTTSALDGLEGLGTLAEDLPPL